MFNLQKIGFALLSTTLVSLSNATPAHAGFVEDLSGAITNSIMEGIFGKKKQAPVQMSDIMMEKEAPSNSTSTTQSPEQLVKLQIASKIDLQLRKHVQNNPQLIAELDTIQKQFVTLSPEYFTYLYSIEDRTTGINNWLNSIAYTQSVTYKVDEKLAKFTGLVLSIEAGYCELDEVASLMYDFHHSYNY